MAGTSRINREIYVRFCGRLVVQFHRPTRREVLAGRKEVTEGAFSVAALAALARRLNVAMPITETLDEVLGHRSDLDVAMSNLLKWLAFGTNAHPRRSEHP